MIKIICDICGKEPKDEDFAFEATLTELRTSLVVKDLNTPKRIHKEMIQICKNCFYEHILKLLKYAKH